MKEHNDHTCPKYYEPVLPDEENNCSLCGAKLINTEEAYQKFMELTEKIKTGA